MRNKGDQRGGPLLGDRGRKTDMTRMSPERSLSPVCHAQVAWAPPCLLCQAMSYSQARPGYIRLHARGVQYVNTEHTCQSRAFLEPLVHLRPSPHTEKGLMRTFVCDPSA